MGKERVTALVAIDAKLTTLRAKIDTLEEAREIMASGRPLDEAPADLRCGAIAESPCSGELASTTCPACGFIASRCAAHGGQRSAGGIVSAHRRYDCAGHPKTTDE